MNYAYVIVWIGELGGIQYIQIASESPETITRAGGKWPIPALVHTATANSFSHASLVCKQWLRENVPEWERRFMRDPARMRPMGVMRSRAARPKTK